MSFRKLCDNQGINEKNIPEGYEHCQSFNHNNAIDGNTKVIIIGTLTPYKGRQSGYFYSAPSNPTFGILDSYFGCNTFSKLKSKLSKLKQNKTVIEDIKEALKKYHIAFLDVVKEAISPISSPADNAIKELILDYDSFKNINKDVVFICNSRAAEYALCKIQKKNNTTNTILYAPQIARIKKGKKQSLWDKALKEGYKLKSK